MNEAAELLEKKTKKIKELEKELRDLK